MDRRELINDPETSLRMAFAGLVSGLWTAIPGEVVSVDLAKRIVSVQPTIQGRIQKPNQTYEFVNLPVLINVPIVFPSAGGFSITFPIKVGDEVLVVFSSRAIDSWWQSSGIGLPVEARTHDLSDGFAIPGPKSIPNVEPAISSENFQIRNQFGTAFIEMTPAGYINITSPVVTINGDLNVIGSIASTENISAVGNVTALGEVFAQLIPLSIHRHSGVSTGSGTSGGPVP